MSNEQKPLALTLEEAMRAVWGRLDELREKHGDLADVQMEITETGWWVFLNNDGKSKNQMKEFDRWEDAASFALGVPVVERNDEADKLRAAIREWAYRMDETMPPRWWEEEPLTDRMAAERNLRRLAGLANDKEQA